MHKETQPVDSNERIARAFLNFFKRLCFIVIGLSLYIIIYFLIIAPNNGRFVVGHSMNPTIHSYTYIFTDPVLPDEEITRGDILLFRPGVDSANSRYIKRLIGLPGDTVEVVNGRAYINGELLDEPYIKLSGKEYPNVVMDMEAITLGEDEYFFIGDNRTNSIDSRNFGPVSRSTVESRIRTENKIRTIGLKKEK